MGTQVPKGLGISVMLIGVPLILWSAGSTNAQLDALDIETSSREVRLDRCIALAGEHGAAPKDQLPLCQCVVDKAAEWGAETRFGGYDERGIEAAVNSCAWQLGL